MLREGQVSLLATPIYVNVYNQHPYTENAVYKTFFDRLFYVESIEKQNKKTINRSAPFKKQ